MNTNVSPPLSFSDWVLPWNSRKGSITAFRQKRSLAIYFLLVVVGLTPYFLQSPAFWQASGLGLLFPGAGFIAVGGWAMLLTIVTGVLFLASLIAWFGSGMVIAPIIIWLGSAFLAGAMVDGDGIWPASIYLIPAITVLLIIAIANKNAKTKKAKLETQHTRKEFILDSLKEVYEKDQEVVSPPHAEREMSKEQVDGLRYALDRALAPIDDYSGYNVIEQFQTSSLRYQINNLAYGIATAQSCYAPSFHGYLSEAQRKLIDRYMQPKIWSYWKWENMWGNFNLNADPAAKDNIMLTGWLNIQVLQYMLNTRDMRYTENGSLKFVLNDKKHYLHDVHSIHKSLMDNFNNPQTLYPCEPNWVYPMCNFKGIAAVKAYDTVFGTNDFERFKKGFEEKLQEEYTGLDGSVIGLRSDLTGIAVPFPVPDSHNALALNPTFPDLAKKFWAIARKEFTAEVNGRLEIKLPPSGADPGNYKSSLVPTLQSVKGAALEMGDYEILEAISIKEKELGLVLENDVLYYKNSSTVVNAGATMDRLLQKGFYRETFTQGPPESVFHGPLLTDCKYPEVLVAKAFSNGTDLNLVLYPGKDDGVQQIKVERLQPGGKYSITNGSTTYFEADQNGNAVLDVQLSGRSEFNIVPN